MLRKLILRGNSIGDDHVGTIVSSLTQCDQLASLDFAHNEAGVGSVVSFVDLLMNCTSLRSLDLGSNRLDHDCIMALVSVLNLKNHSLKKCVLDRPSFSSVMQESCWHVNRMLRVNTGLAHLSLQRWQLRADGMHTLCQSL